MRQIPYAALTGREYGQREDQRREAMEAARILRLKAKIPRARDMKALLKEKARREAAR